MADKNDSVTSDAAEKAYEAAASTVPVTKPAPEPKAAAPAAPAPKVETPVAKVALAEAPVAKAPEAPKAPAKVAAVTKAPAKKPVVKKTPAKKPAAAKAPAKAPVLAKAAKPAAPKKPAAKKPETLKPAKIAAKAKTPIQPIVSNVKEFFMATANKNTDYKKIVTETIATVKDKAKVAYEKGSAAVGEIGDIAKGNVEAVVESGKILASGVQDLGRGYVEETKGAFETATADMKKFAAIKSPTELYQLQGELMRRNFDSAVAFSSKSSEQFVKLANEAFAPLSTRFSVLAEKASKAA